MKESGARLVAKASGAGRYGSCSASDGMLFCFLLRRTHFVHCQVRSASVRTKSGSTKHSTISVTRWETSSGGVLPRALFSKGLASSSAVGSPLWLHLLMTTPWRSSSSPGLLRMTVLSVVPSVM